jgi:crossover junction endodeoxyribonuclease RusA
VSVSFRVFGLAAPQGSARAFMAGGKPVITSANKNLGHWRRLVADASQNYAQMHDGPVAVVLQFYMQRPKTVKRHLPTTTPDLDKLIRAVGDSLTGIMWHDDSQVTSLTADKTYADEDNPPGVHIWISEDVR